MLDNVYYESFLFFNVSVFIFIEILKKLLINYAKFKFMFKFMKNL